MSRQTGTCDMVKYIIHIFIIIIFSGCLICKCVILGINMGNNSFKDLRDFGTFSLLRLLRNLTPPSGGGWPMFALGLDIIRRDGGGCSGQIVYTDARVHILCM